jgi:hypothetical protein
MGAILISFLYSLLYCAIVILIAYAFVWGLRFVGVSIDGQVYKWGQIAIALICVIILLTWLLGALGMVGGGPYIGPRFR